MYTNIVPLNHSQGKINHEIPGTTIFINKAQPILKILFLAQRQRFQRKLIKSTKVKIPQKYHSFSEREETEEINQESSTLQFISNKLFCAVGGATSSSHPIHRVLIVGFFSFLSLFLWWTSNRRHCLPSEAILYGSEVVKA